MSNRESDGAKDSTRVPRQGFIKPWEFWVMFFVMFILGVLLSLYGRSISSDIIVAGSILCTAAILTVYVQLAGKWVISE